MKIKSIRTTGGLALALTARSAFGRPYFVLQIPYGSSFGCPTCHTSGFGWNTFGQSFKNNNRVWSATLAGFDSDGFGFDLSGMSGQTVVIEASPNLTSWTPILTNLSVTGYFHFNDCDSTNCAQRFYRTRLMP